MKKFDLQGVEILANYREAFNFISKPQNLTKWTQAFKSADDTTAELQTPQGVATIKLKTSLSESTGTIDWHMEFADGSKGSAFSRLLELEQGLVLYSFTLLAPPVPLEILEGTLMQQSKTLAQELQNLKKMLEKG